MPPRDPWHRRRLYDGDLYWQTFIRWTLWGVRGLAVPTAALALLLAVDAARPGPVTQGMPYARSVESHLLGADGVALRLVRLGDGDCAERTEGKLLLYAHRAGCTETVVVREDMGRSVGGRDTLEVARTPLFGWVRAVERPADGLRDGATALWTIGGYVLLGLLPLLSFGPRFARSPVSGGADRRFMVYVVPALVAEAVYLHLAAGLFG
ncbi:MAG: hypothetical protein ACLFTE_08080 [Salinivenus sp.]